MKDPRIVVVGSINLDMVVRSARIPSPGETVVGRDFMMVGGGKGANQAVAAARLGAKVALIGRVGADAFGSQALTNLEEEGIDVRFVSRDLEHSTGVALILVDDHGENLISVASGANMHLRPEDVEKAEDLIREADLLMLQLEVPMETIAFAARLARKHAVPVILNPAPAAPLDDELLADVDWLTPNEIEAEHLTCLVIQNEADAKVAARHLIERGVKQVVVTLGAKGALMMDSRNANLLSAYPVPVRDTTAAGDAFNAALACSLARGRTLRHSVRFANLVGACSVTRNGAQPSLPTAREVEDFMPSVVR